jgi:hypothetical protein
MGVIVIALCGASWAQTDTATPASATAPTETESQPATDTSAPSRQKPFYKKLFTPQAFYATVPGAVLQQVHHWPEEWGDNRLGFEKRVGSLYGQFVIGMLIEDGVRAVHPEDTRYVRLGKGNFFRRTAHVITGTVVARKPDGSGRTIALSLPANAYGSWAIATLWSPKEYRTAGSILEWGTAGMGVTASTNLFREFWPDIKGVFHKNK